MNDLIKIFEKTFKDKTFTRTEQQAVRKILKEYQLNEREKDLLRSKIFDLAERALSDGNQYLVLKWIEEAVKLIMKSGDDKDEETNNVYFSPGNDCLNAITDALRNARTNVLICVFTISDNRITREIINCHKRGVNLKVITDNDKTYDKGSDIEWLHNEGIQVKVDKTDKHMHHKFAVVDNELLITGSYNWTRSAAEYNEENILVTNNEKNIKAYVGEFEKLWPCMMDY